MAAINTNDSSDIKSDNINGNIAESDGNNETNVSKSDDISDSTKTGHILEEMGVQLDDLIELDRLSMNTLTPDELQKLNDLNELRKIERGLRLIEREIKQPVVKNLLGIQDSIIYAVSNRNAYIGFYRKGLSLSILRKVHNDLAEFRIPEISCLAKLGNYSWPPNLGSGNYLEALRLEQIKVPPCLRKYEFDFQHRLDRYHWIGWTYPRTLESNLVQLDCMATIALIIEQLISKYVETQDSNSEQSNNVDTTIDLDEVVTKLHLDKVVKSDGERLTEAQKRRARRKRNQPIVI